MTPLFASKGVFMGCCPVITLDSLLNKGQVWDLDRLFGCKYPNYLTSDDFINTSSYITP